MSNLQIQIAGSKAASFVNVLVLSYVVQRICYRTDPLSTRSYHIYRMLQKHLTGFEI